MKKQFVFEKLYQNAPLIVLNSLSGEGLHMKLMASMFQNMFPTINITKVRKADLRGEIIRAFNGSLCYGSRSMLVYMLTMSTPVFLVWFINVRNLVYYR